jgi:hypothetical protein
MPSDQDLADLDLAVARAELARGGSDVRISDAGVPTIETPDGRWERFRPSTNWAHAGPIIEGVGIDLVTGQSGRWIANIGYTVSVIAETPLVAAMRAYMASKTPSAQSS